VSARAAGRCRNSPPGRLRYTVHAEGQGAWRFCRNAMGQIIKFPGPASKFGFKRVKKRAAAEHPDQLPLFPRPTAQILNFAPKLSWFEQTLL